MLGLYVFCLLAAFANVVSGSCVRAQVMKNGDSSACVLVNVCSMSYNVQYIVFTGGSLGTEPKWTSLSGSDVTTTNNTQLVISISGDGNLTLQCDVLAQFPTGEKPKEADVCSKVSVLNSGMDASTCIVSNSCGFGVLVQTFVYAGSTTPSIRWVKLDGATKGSDANTQTLLGSSAPISSSSCGSFSETKLK